MGKYKGVIFDLDGTLLNTIEDLSDSVNEVLTYYGYPIHSYEAYKLKIGRGFRNLLEQSLPEGVQSEKLLDEALRLFLNTYDRKYTDKTRPYEGISELLLRLKDKGIKIGVNSNKRTDYTNHLIRLNFPEIPFVDIIGERENIPKKPNPVSALEIAEKMDLPVSEIIYIGDSGTDIQTGKNANMDTAGVLWGFRGRTELSEKGAVYIVEKAEDILDLF